MAAIQESYAARKLAQMRDELRIKRHLAKADAKIEWEKLEAKWRRFERKSHALEKATDQTRNEIREVVDQLGRELKEGYERLRQVI